MNAAQFALFAAELQSITRKKADKQRAVAQQQRRLFVYQREKLGLRDFLCQFGE